MYGNHIPILKYGFPGKRSSYRRARGERRDKNSYFGRVGMGLRHNTAAENEAAGVKPLGGLVGLPPAKASIPVRRRGTSK